MNYDDCGHELFIKQLTDLSMVLRTNAFSNYPNLNFRTSDPDYDHRRFVFWICVILVLSSSSLIRQTLHSLNRCHGSLMLIPLSVLCLCSSVVSSRHPIWCRDASHPSIYSIERQLRPNADAVLCCMHSHSTYFTCCTQTPQKKKKKNSN